MKPQSKLVQAIKGKIQSMLKLIALGVKKYVLALLELEAKLEAAMSEQLDSFEKLKADVVKQLNNAAWEHLVKWSADPYKWECNDNYYLSKIHTRSRDLFKSFQSRFDALEKIQNAKDEQEENARLALLPEISEEEKVRRAGMWLPQ